MAARKESERERGKNRDTVGGCGEREKKPTLMYLISPPFLSVS